MINKWLSNAAAFFLYLISLLPLKILYLFSDGLYVILFHVIKYRRHVVLKNLQNSFPEKGIMELKSLEKKYYAYLADLIFETIKMFSASPEFLYKRYTFTNLELLKRYETEGQSYLMAVGHYGNWEWNTIVLSMVSTTMPVIIYKPLNNKVFDRFFKKAREKSGTKMVSMKNTMREIIHNRDKTTVTVFATDQTPVRSSVYGWIDFLNQDTATFLGLEKIAKSTGYPVVFCDMSVPKRGHYHAEFFLITENPKETEELEIIKKYTCHLENKINKAPEYWLWSHKRWKRKR